MSGKRCIIRMPRTRKGRALTLFLLAALACAIWLLWPRPAAAPAESPRLMAAGEGLTAYDVALRLNPEENTLSLTETIDYRNDTGDTLDTLVLRMWLNAYQSEEASPAALEEIYDACYPNGFSPGDAALYDVIWNGQAVSHAYLDEAQTALEISIPGLADGERGVLTLRCVMTLPDCAHRAGRASGIYQLGNILPLVSRYEGGAWRTDAYAPIGDPFVSACANFTVTLHVPDPYVPACSAPLTKGEDGAWRGSLTAARDLALCVSEGYQVAAAWEGSTRVLSYAKTESGAKRALQYARKALSVLSELYGEYPYPAFTVCQADFPFGGMEYPGMCLIAQSYYLESQADSLELIVAHETAHQWFYALVGSDQFFQPWQDEALCEYAMLRYVRKVYGQSSYDSLKYYRVDAAMQESIPGALTPGSPIDYFGTLNDYTAVVYGRGAALLLALEEMLPGGTDAFLRAYCEQFAFGYATRADFEAFLNGYAGMDLAPLLLDYLDTAQ